METLVTQSEYAKYRGVDPSLISRWKKENRLVMVGNKVHVAGSDAVLDRDRDTRGGNQFDDTDVSRSEYLAIKARETHWSAEQKRLKAEQIAGKLVEADGVEREAFSQARLLRDAFLNIPDRVSAALAVETDPIIIHQTLTTEIRNVCNQLAGLAQANDDSIPITRTDS